jgi:hypothetical protein
MDSDDGMKIHSIVLFSVIYLGCMKDSDIQKVQQASAKFKDAYCNLAPVFHITWGDRFGEKIIHVEVISPQDESVVRKQMPDEFEGFHVHIVSPIWRTGELVPELSREFDVMMSQDFYRATPKGQWEATEFGRKIVEAEKNVWSAWSEKQRKEFIQGIILERRKKTPTYANCGDKFLKTD